MFDANVQLQASATKTATFTGTALDLKTMTPRRGLKARLLITAAPTGTTETLDVKVQESADNTTFNDLVVFDQITTAAKEFVETVETSKRYIRALGTISGTLPVYVLQIDIGIAKP